jgi:hypothetical protein
LPAVAHQNIISKPDIKVTPTRSIYLNNDVVTVSIRNRSLKKQYFELGLEILVGNRWNERLGDYNEDYYSIPRRIIKLEPGKMTSVKFRLSQIGKDKLRHWKKFKFLLKYSETMNSINHKITSGEFEIK